MNRLDKTVDDHLRTIVANCPRLLTAMQCSPEAVLRELQAMESACRAFNEACGNLHGKSEEASKIMALMADMRGQFVQQGLIDDQELAAFREDVVAIRCCASTLRDTLGQSRAP